MGYESLPITCPENYRSPADYKKAFRAWNGFVGGLFGTFASVIATVYERVPESNELTDTGKVLGIVALGCAALAGVALERLDHIGRTALIPEPEPEKEPSSIIKV